MPVEPEEFTEEERKRYSETDEVSYTEEREMRDAAWNVSEKNILQRPEESYYEK